jgi:hypothetical protein
MTRGLSGRRQAVLDTIFDTFRLDYSRKSTPQMKATRNAAYAAIMPDKPLSGAQLDELESLFLALDDLMRSWETEGGE